MRKVSRILLKVLFVLISIICIDGGGSLLITGNNIQLLLTKDQGNDIEASHQQHLFNNSDDEKWVEILKFDFSCFNQIPLEFLYTRENSPQEFPDSIWQPPKFV